MDAARRTIPHPKPARAVRAPAHSRPLRAPVTCALGAAAGRTAEPRVPERAVIIPSFHEKPSRILLGTFAAASPEPLGRLLAPCAVRSAPTAERAFPHRLCLT